MEMYKLLNSIDKEEKLPLKIVNRVGDCPNAELPIMPETLFWKTISSKSGWECQVNIVYGKARIVSPDRMRMANGSRNAMLEKMRRLLNDEFIEAGDILGVPRYGLYEHYAIYIGNGRVIHYAGEDNDFEGKITIHEAPLSDFIKDSKDFFVVWFDEGRPIKIHKNTTFLFDSAMELYNKSFQRRKRKVFSAEETIERARSRIGEAEYNVAFKNCEHFAMWCKTGVEESSQVKNIMNFLMFRGISGYGI